MAYSPNYFGAQAKGSSRQTITNYINGNGGVLNQGTPVATNSSGQMVQVDPSNESLVLAIIGLVGVTTNSGANGPVVDNGRLENITTSFAVGTPLYVSKAGTLQSDQPSIGVDGFAEGDFVIFVGVVAQNEFNHSNKDIKLMLTVVGQL